LIKRTLDKRKVIYKIILWLGASFLTISLLLAGFAYLFKDKIIAASITEINKYLNVKVDINPKIELSLFEKFPQVAIEFSDVKIFESIPESKNLLGQAEKVYLTFNVKNILDGNYIINKLYIENGAFHLKVAKNGTTNYTILKPDSSKQNQQGNGFDLNAIYVKNVLIKYDNQKNEQQYEILSHELIAGVTLKNHLYLITLNGDQYVKTINIHNDEYFKEKEIVLNSAIEYDDAKNYLKILPTTIKVQNSEFTVEGYSSFESKNTIDFKINNTKSDAQTLLSLIPKKYEDLFSAYKSDGEVYFNATIKGVVSDKENPAIDVQFGTKSASFSHPDLKKKITDATFYGIFSNGEKRNAQSSFIKIENIRFDFDGKMIQGDFLYKNFSNPYIAFDATGTLNAGSAMEFYKIPGIKSAGGQIDFDFEFKGLLEDLKKREGHSRIETGGEITLKNIQFSSDNIAYPIENINGTFLFNKNDIAVTDFTAQLGKSDIAFNGFMKNLFGIILLDNSRMYAELNVKSKLLDIEEMLHYQFDENENESKSEGKFPYLEKYVLDLNLDIQEVLYKKVSLKNLKSNLHFDQPSLSIPSLTCQLAGGEISLNSITLFDSEDKIQTTIRSNLSSINIDMLFYMFDDFGQSFITNKNLKGEFNGSVETIFYWNNKGEIDTKSLVANIDCSILKGELVNFEPMQNLARFIDAQELSQIKFSELKNKIFIENRIITLPEMHILSNVSDITIAGTHTFDNYMDYKLAVPLKNLKKHKVDKDASFGAIEEDPKKGSTLFLTIKGNSENYKFGYDTKRTKTKISEDLKKEKKEFLDLFKKKEEEVLQKAKPNQEEFFDFD